MAIKVLRVTGEQSELLDAVIALGDRYTKTLGPADASRVPQAAEDGGSPGRHRSGGGDRLRAVRAPEEERYIRLAHLCVAEEQRGRGIARLLVEAIKRAVSATARYQGQVPTGLRTQRHVDEPGFVPNGEVRGGAGTERSSTDGGWISDIRICSRRRRATRCWW